LKLVKNIGLNEKALAKEECVSYFQTFFSSIHPLLIASFEVVKECIATQFQKTPHISMSA